MKLATTLSLSMLILLTAATSIYAQSNSYGIIGSAAYNQNGQFEANRGRNSHYALDVIVGAVIGAGAGFFIGLTAYANVSSSRKVKLGPYLGVGTAVGLAAGLAIGIVAASQEPAVRYSNSDFVFGLPSIAFNPRTKTSSILILRADF